MVFSLGKYITKLSIIIIVLLLLNGCAWIAGVALAGAVSTIVLTSGSVIDVDNREKAVVVEKLIYAFEANGATVYDVSFTEGYVKGSIDKYKVTAYLYPRENGDIDISVRARKYLISNSYIAQQIIDTYRGYKNDTPS